ncbi:helix-turn-helix transcriptional regulator [Hyphomicrobium sp.]|uniref:helix-turn-helix transcriptional regulator n=1 Tax=Hyphomicrobium sp. TaxID=82 RepID=UPI0025C1AC40|nr:helix-turn-helix transcriptional regulator [Hyphomicrobium sp.]MCC7253576.1 helix-turn-helix transcriptional regulator [Hyphomicrobium sp.]
MAADLGSAEGLLDLVGEIYDCAIAPAKWPGTLAHIAQLLDGRQAAITLNTLSRPDFSFQAKWNVPPDYARLMHEHVATNPFMPMAWYQNIGDVTSMFRMVDEAELKRSTWFHKTHVATGQGDAALVLLARSVSQFGVFSVHREGHQHPFTDEDLAILSALAPHIRRAVMIADMLDARALERDMLSATLDRIAVGVVLTDGDGCIAHAHEAAARLIEQGHALRRVGDEISAGDPDSARELARAIADAASGTTSDIPRSGILVVLKDPAGHDLAAWVLPLDNGLRRDLGAEYTARAAVFIRDLGDTSPLPAELFVRRFAITPAECRLLVLLVQGMSVTESAETLGISLPTARTHLAHLFEKTGTSRQIDLVRLAMRALSPVS